MRRPVKNQVIRERRFLFLYLGFFYSVNESLRLSLLSNRSGSRGDRLESVMVSDNVCNGRKRS